MVKQGTQRDAILFSVGANAVHGQRRTNSDKRRAVETLLRDEEWSKWSGREIARRCGVHHSYVAKLRPILSTSDSMNTFIHPKTGKPTTMDTTNIGRKPTIMSKEQYEAMPEPVRTCPAIPSV